MGTTRKISQAELQEMHRLGAEMGMMVVSADYNPPHGEILKRIGKN